MVEITYNKKINYMTYISHQIAVHNKHLLEAPNRRYLERSVTIQFALRNWNIGFNELNDFVAWKKTKCRTISIVLRVFEEGRCFWSIWPIRATVCWAYIVFLERIQNFLDVRCILWQRISSSLVAKTFDRLKGHWHIWSGNRKKTQVEFQVKKFKSKDI